MYILHDLDQLTILLPSIEARDWHTIAQLRGERKDLVIDDERAGQIDSLQDVQVLVVGLLTLVSNRLAMLTEESVLD